jgi:hypothetical protein
MYGPITYTIDIPDFTLPADGWPQRQLCRDASPPTPPVMQDACGNHHHASGWCGTIPTDLRRRHGLIRLRIPIALPTPMSGLLPIRSIFRDFTLPADGASTVNCAANATPPTPPVMRDACATPSHRWLV